MDELAIACNLSPDELRERGDDLLPGLLRLAESQQPMEAGYVLPLPCRRTLNPISDRRGRASLLPVLPFRDHGCRRRWSRLPGSQRAKRSPRVHR